MTEVEITNMKKEVDYWTEYKDKGQHQHAKQIRALEGEVEDMNFSFNEMKGKFAKILDTEIKTIKNIFFSFLQNRSINHTCDKFQRGIREVFL